MEAARRSLGRGLRDGSGKRGAAEPTVRQHGALQRRQREPDGVKAKIAGEARPQRLRSDTHIAHKIKRQRLKQCAQEQWASMRAVKRLQNVSPWQFQADNFDECHKQAISEGVVERGGRPWLRRAGRKVRRAAQTWRLARLGLTP